MTTELKTPWYEKLFFTLVAIGVIDMSLQSFTNGNFRLIRRLLTAIFGEPS